MSAAFTTDEQGFYRVVQDDYCVCNTRQQDAPNWTIVSGTGEQECGIGQSWGHRETADDVCDLMNMAYDAGREKLDILGELGPAVEGCEMSKPRAQTEKTARDERDGADRCWIWRDGYHYPRVSFSRPDPKVHPSVEYMRVLSRQEVEKLAGDEGVDVQQLLNSYRRTIEGQRKHIAILQRKIEELENPTAHAAAGVTGHD